MKLNYTFALFFLLTIHNFAQELVYTPKNPSFGGSSFNHAWMMSEAEAQNTFTSKSTFSSSLSDRDALSDFEESLNRQILSQLSRQIVSDTFGETEFEEGTYEIGSYIIEITNDLDGVNINITDDTNGSETSIIIPYF
ncbi:MAG: curli assembly protein CsgF [Ignavibacteriales bacterium]|nr:curli assembly protein CsgF [Ignavibacteriales bacterium]